MYSAPTATRAARPGQIMPTFFHSEVTAAAIRMTCGPTDRPTDRPTEDGNGNGGNGGSGPMNKLQEWEAIKPLRTQLRAGRTDVYISWYNRGARLYGTRLNGHPA